MRPRAPVLALFLYGGLCVLFYAAPLTSVLHAESAAILAASAYFIAGLSCLAQFRAGVPFAPVLLQSLAALLLPWLLLTVSLFWVPNCGYLQGLVLFVLFVPVSVVLAVSVAYALTGLQRRSRFLFVASGLAVLVAGPLYDLGWHPQFYVYSHIFGGILGPLYDEELALRPGLVAFRVLTLLWACLFWQLGRWLRTRRIHPTYLFATACIIGLCYLLSVPLGFNTSERQIQRALGGHLATEHFDLYYAPETLHARELELIAQDHVFRYAQLEEQLGVRAPGRIASFLYPDPDTKARLTGARRTNIAPVWLRRPQVHILASSYAAVFPHELAHVFSRAFGLPILRASLSVGLIEGLAVALEPPNGLPTPHEQIAVHMANGDEVSGVADDLASRLSPLGFWTGQSAASYTMMGSFVRYLLDAYGVERLRRVYAWGDFEAVYGKSAHTLAGEWERYVLSLPASDRATGEWVSRQFSIPSLFDTACPHHVPRYVRRHRDGLRAMTDADTTQAQAFFAASLRLHHGYEPALSALAELEVLAGRPEHVTARLDTLPSEHWTAAVYWRQGDAYAALRKLEKARAAYEAALDLLPAVSREATAHLLLRQTLTEIPGALPTALVGHSRSTRARRLLALDSTSVTIRMMAAVLLAGDEEYAQAIGLLRTIRTVQRDVLRRHRLVWLARWNSLAGSRDAASGYAREAAREFRAIGAWNAAALHTDFARGMTP